jgi:MoaA/NifB/PqqE/SkfB family radical SAM enzyme
MAFSLAGVGPNNNMTRKGTDFDTILKNVKKIKEAKDYLQKDKPNIHIAYLLLKSRLNDLEHLSDALGDCGVSQIVVSTLDFVPDRELEKEVIRPENLSEYNELRPRLESIAAELNQFGIRLHYHLRHPTERQKVCTENIERSFYVSAGGDVSPCVFSGLPISGAEYYVKGNSKAYQPLIFGNINEKSIARIWFQKDYEAFRESFEKEIPDYICLDCPKLYMT